MMALDPTSMARRRVGTHHASTSTTRRTRVTKRISSPEDVCFFMLPARVKWLEFEFVSSCTWTGGLASAAPSHPAWSTTHPTLGVLSNRQERIRLVLSKVSAGTGVLAPSLSMAVS
jgi:hypothetical protein